uniref:Survival of motor neuron-related-splicing factor 30 n=1 Tax=Glossina brevipalpis TaxID=37001 RepID=A0A1A9X118_9MUSC
MSLLEKLKDQGWYLTEEGLKKLTTELQNEDITKLIAEAKDWDLKELGGGALPSKLDSNGTIAGRIVLQIQRIRNVSAPKANEESTVAPRLLQFELTDGIQTIQGIELEHLSCLHLNTPPGTKLFFKADKIQIMQGFLVLKPDEVQNLEGNVEHLVEKWDLARQMQKYARSGMRINAGSGGPPPWIAFGKRLDTHKEALTQDRNFKSLQAANEKDKESKENDEFQVMRSEAIAEAAKAGVKKVFGGGQQNILDHNVKKILDKGYSEEEAKQALKGTHNNLERALYNLKRKKDPRNGNNETHNRSETSSGRRQRGGRVNSTKEDVSVPTKPAGNVSLFDFLTNKLPATSETTTAASTSANQSQQRKEVNSGKQKSVEKGKFENNMSSSFAANRATQVTDGPLKEKSNYKDERRRDYRNSNATKTPYQNSTPSTQANNLSSSGDTFNNNRRNEKSFRKEGDYAARGVAPNYHNKRGDYKQQSHRDRNPHRSDSKRLTVNANNSCHSNILPAAAGNTETDVTKLVESTSDMKIESKRDNYQTPGQSRKQQKQLPKVIHQQSTQQQQQQLTQPTTVYVTNNPMQSTSEFISTQNFLTKSKSAAPTSAFVGQLSNGFPYDPSKIMGFQSKEANEYAMNLLKSQEASTAARNSAPVAPPSSVSQPPITLNSSSTGSFIANANPNSYGPSSSQPAVPPPLPPSVAYEISPGANWPWKKGDRCLAKYWEDGKYYEAEITNISNTTCVVLFMGYGNFEEVLKSDCLPLTDAQHHTVIAYQNLGPSVALAPPPLSTGPQLVQPQQPFQRSNNVGNSQRYRSERQMYVPPPKRGANN